MPDVVQHLLALHVRAEASEEESLDSLVTKLGQFYFSTQDYHLASGKMMEILMDANASSLQTRMNRVACALFLYQVHQRSCLEHALSKSVLPQNLIYALDYCAYDETPLKVSLHEGPICQDDVPTALDALAETLQAPGGKHVFMERGSAVLCKMFQCQSASAYLLRLADGIMGLSVPFHTPLQSMSRTTHDVVAQCIARLNGTSGWAEQFQVKARGVCCDGAGSNMKGEHEMMRDRKGWLHCMFICDIHKVASLHKKSYEALHSEQIVGLLHTALSLRTQCSWETFRTAVATVLRNMPLEIVHERAPDEVAMQYKTALLTHLYTGSGSGLATALELLLVFNGDWRVKGKLQFCWDPAKRNPPSKLVIVESMVRAAKNTFLSHKPGVWPRSRWTGFRASLRDVLIICSIHGILHPCYNKFLELLGHSKKSASHDHGASSGSVALSAALVGHVDDGRDEIDKYMSLGVAEREGDAQTGLPDSTTMSFAKLNSRDRDISINWLAQDPLPYLLLIGFTLQPLDALMEAHFRLASSEWEEQQSQNEGFTFSWS
eukprot:6461808-Amphidinium_carterae.1